MRAEGFLVHLLLFALVVASLSPHVTGKAQRAQEAPIPEGAYLEWSFTITSPDGTSTQEGGSTAQVSYGSWNGRDSVMVEGSTGGTFSSSEGSGSFQGTYREYYTTDLALMYRYSSIETEIDGFEVTVTNVTRVQYEMPYYRWISLPLYTGPPPKSWSVDVWYDLTWELYYSDGGEEGGVARENIRENFICPTEEQLTVEGGTFDTFKILGGREDDSPLDRSSEVWYSEEVGWWVKKDVWASSGEERVNVQHMELTEVSSNSPPEVLMDPSVTMNEDEVDDSVLLTSVFNDPDGDELTCGVDDNGTLPAYVEDGRLMIEPVENWHGSAEFVLWADDGRSPKVNANVTVEVLPVDDPPVLEDARLFPTSGDENTVFEFTVTVYDAEGDIPASVVLSIDGEGYGMDLESGQMETGALFSWEGTLPAGEHQYHITAGGTRLPGTGELSGPTVSSSDVYRLTSPALDPEMGGSRDTYSFSIIWEHSGGQYPDGMDLIVDATTYTLTGDGSDPEYGTEYSWRGTLPEGDHFHHFTATMGGINLRYPEDGEIEGPLIHDPFLKAEGAFPEDPAEGDEITFFVVYVNRFGDDPVKQEVVLDGRGHTLTAISGTPETGLNLTYKTVLDPGDHLFRFEVDTGREVIESVDHPLHVEPGNGGGTEQTGDGNGSSTFVTLIIIIVILSALSLAAYFFVFRSGEDVPGEEDPEGDTEDVTSQPPPSDSFRRRRT